MRAAFSFSSATRSSALCSFNRCRVPPKLFVRMMSAPASTKPAVQLRDPIRMLRVPKFGCIARPQTAFEQVAAGRAVREQPRPLRQ